MRQSEERYISLLTDFGFKRIFGTDPNKIFSKLFDAAAIARFSPTELREYEDSLKAYRDIKNSLDTAEAKGRAEGRAEGINLANLATAQRMISDGVDIELVMKYTGLTKEQIEDSIKNPSK